MPALFPIAADARDPCTVLEAADLRTDDIGKPVQSFLRCDDGGEPAGYGGYGLLREGALVRSVVVLPTERGRGNGRDVPEAVQAQAAAADARRNWLTTTASEDFFVHTVFTRIDRNATPPEILDTGHAAPICTTAALITGALDG